MSHNRKVLRTATKELGKAKAPAKPKDIITDPMGQWKYPGQNTRIPGSDITMQGVNYPVFAQPNVGQPQMMYPGQEYQFPGADYVDEFPQGGNEDYYEDELDEEQIAELRAGGYTVEDISVPQLTQQKKGGSLKKYSRSLEATNKLFRESPLLKKTKSKKKKIFDPSSSYFDVGGIPNLPLREGRKAYERLGYTDNDRMAVAAEGGFLPKAQTGMSSPYYSYGDKKYIKKGNDWLVESNGKYIPLSKNVKSRTAELNKNAKYIAEKKLEKSPYQLQQEAKRNSGQSNYDMMVNNPSQISENTRPNNVSKIDQRANFENGIIQKSNERQAIAEKIKNSNFYTDEDKAAILMNPQRLDEHSYLLGEQRTAPILKESIPQGKLSRTWEYITNPFTAAEYAISGGGAENMPHNINQMRMAGIDPGVVQGRNLVGNTLNSSVNLIDAGDKVARNIGAGNYGSAALEAMRFIPAGKAVKPLLGNAPKITKNIINAGYAGMGTKALNTISPLNLVKFYGKKLKGATVPMGNIIENVVDANKINRPMDPIIKSYRNLRQMKKIERPLTTAKNMNKRSSDVFSMKVDPNVAGSNISISNQAIPKSKLNSFYKTFRKELSPNYNPERTSEFNIQHLGQDATHLPLTDPAVSLHRRLPFSNRYVPVNSQKLMNNKFQLSTAGALPQSLAERYGSTILSSGLIGAAALGHKYGYGNMFKNSANAVGEDFTQDINPYFINLPGDLHELYKETKKTKKTGGAIEMDVDDDMIQYLLSQGYDVEDID